MLYLEDFLEVIENVPQEVRDRTTELRELDLGIQNNRDQLEDKIKNFFSTAKKTKLPERHVAYKKIRDEYYKLLDDADEKSNIATNMADSVDRYIRKLDQEIEKFKYELEADNPGITETLEKRSLELDEPIKDSQKENRYKNHHGSRSSDWRVPIKREDSFANLNSSPPQSLSFNLAQIGTGVLGVGSSPGLGTGSQSRRSSSIKSYDPLSPGFLSSQFSLSTDLLNSSTDLLSGSSSIPSLSSTSGLGSSLSSALAGVSSGSIKSSSSSQSSSNKRQKKKQNSTSGPNTSSAHNADTLLSAMADDSIPEQVAALESPDWSYDPNEPRYCVCNQVSYGDMVACDNPRCTVEWFHYPCVGITDPPKGKWYCPQCSASMNRRQRK